MSTATNATTPVGVLGATGIVGQHLIKRLNGHPLFRLNRVAASSRTAGRALKELPWHIEGELPREAADFVVLNLAVDEDFQRFCAGCDYVFSAASGSDIQDLEERLLNAGKYVVSNASCRRLDPTVPLAIGTCVNSSIFDSTSRLIKNPNCVVAGVAIVLRALHEWKPISSVNIATMQAVSGAGLAAPHFMRAGGNVLPYIQSEEEKIEAELHKLVGEDMSVSAMCNRVPVDIGHTASVFVSFAPGGGSVTAEEVQRYLEEVAEGKTGPPMKCSAVSAPETMMKVFRERDQPQPKFFAAEYPMTVGVGGIRKCVNGDVKFTVVSNNLHLGAAGVCMLNAELLLQREQNRK